MYSVDPNNPFKSVPKAKNIREAYGRASAPAAETEVARATYVIINVESATKYEFKYESGGSYVDYGIVAADGPLRVDIQPIAWKGGAGTTGHVSFVYRGD
jgi:hypothetical protein